MAVVVLLLLLIGGVLLGLVGVEGRVGQCSSHAVRIGVSQVSPRGIGEDFISFSVEVDVILEWTGKWPDPPRASFLNLMRQLGKPVIRVGGDSTDYSWYNPNGLPYPPYKTRPFRYNITDVDIHSIYNAVKAYGGAVVFGVNFRPPLNASYAINHLQAIDSIIGLNNPTILAIEIGNEVDLYGRNQDRDPSWAPSDYYFEWENYISQITQALPHVSPQRLFQGATYCCYNEFEDDLHTFIPRDFPYMKTLSIHHYPDNTDSTTTLSYQLSDYIATEGALLLTEKTKSGNIISVASKYGLDVVVGEGNSNSEPGVLGVCDVFGGSAIWVIDEFFNLAKVGLRRFHVHSHEKDLRAPFYLNEGNAPVIRPLFYGLRFFSYILEGVVEPYLINTTVTCSVDELLKTWAVRSEDGTLKVALIYKNLTQVDPLTVTLDVSTVIDPTLKSMYLIRMVGTPLMKEDITLAGQTWSGSPDGLPVGKMQVEEAPIENGTITLLVAPITAVLLSSLPFKEQ